MVAQAARVALPAVLGGNLFGVTSWLLSQDGGVLAERSRLDVLVPVNGLRRCLDRDNGFTFLYPARWLADQVGLPCLWAAHLELGRVPSMRTHRCGLL